MFELFLRANLLAFVWGWPVMRFGAGSSVATAAAEAQRPQSALSGFAK
jgi:hypothetical protein